MVTISQILQYNWPNAVWSMQDAGDYDTLVWDESNANPKPTLEEIQSYSTAAEAAITLKAQQKTQLSSLLDDPSSLLTFLDTVVGTLKDLRSKINSESLSSPLDSDLWDKVDDFADKLIQLKQMT